MLNRLTQSNVSRWTGHYSPLWLAVFPAGIKLYLSDVHSFSPNTVATTDVPVTNEPTMATSSIVPSPTSGTIALTVSSELIFAMLGFWIWALVTNAHGHKLVRSGGRDSGKKDERKDEFSFILFLFILTIAMYVFAIKPVNGVPTLVPFFVASIFPILILWKPPYAKPAA